jgi:hypothetical protein
MMKTIEFYGDTLEVVDMNGQPGVTARRLVENLGLDWSTQLEKLQDPLFNCGHMPAVGADGKQREMLVLPVDRLPAFLFSINPKKVREDLQEKLARYRLECAGVLYNYWAKGYAVNPRQTPEGALKDYSEGVGAVHLNLLNTVLDGANTEEHRAAISEVLMEILREALMVEDIDLAHNLIRKRSGWVHMTRSQMTLVQTIESEAAVYFLKEGLPATVEGVIKAAEKIGTQVTRRLNRAATDAEGYSEKFSESITNLLGK